MNFRNALFLVVFWLMLPLAAVDLFCFQEWKSYSDVNLERIEVDGRPAIRLTYPRTAEKKTWGQVSLHFSPLLDLRNAGNLEISVKSNRKIYVSMGLMTRKGNLWSGWLKNAAGPQERTWSKAIREIKGWEKTDLAQTVAFTIGLGLYGYDTTKEELEVVVTGMTAVEPSDRFLIPRPTAGVSIDGGYKEDWGLEDVLYNWHEPVFVPLRPLPGDSGTNRISPKDLSGKCSFMYDDKYLYFLCIAADQTLFSGKDVIAPWNNDSVELFLAAGVKNRHLAKGKSLAECGFQIIFDCSAGGKPFLFRNRKRVDGTALGIQTKLVRENQNVDGDVVPGYVLEAAIPWSLFREWTPVKGALLGYCVNLNDSGGKHLRSSPECRQPAGSTAGYSRAYLEYAAPEKKEEFRFGKCAENIPWPKEYNAAGKRIWAEEFCIRIPASATAERFYLNGFWAVQGFPKEEQSPDPGNWLYAPLPMGIGWYTPVFQARKEGTPLPASYQKISRNGKNPFYWYERKFRVPEHWKNGSTRLVVRSISKEAAVFLNGVNAGTLSMLHPELEVGRFLEAGKDVRIALHLFTEMSPGIPSGITGDLYLEHSAEKPVIRDIWARRADPRSGNFRFEIRTDRVEGGRIEAEILSPEGRVLWKGGRNTERSGTAVFTGRCSEVPVWSVEQPKLCRLKIVMRSAAGKLLEEKIQEFGFRTFETKNGRFLLNGKKIRLRVSTLLGTSNTCEPGRFAYLKSLGYNAIYLTGVRGDLDRLFSELDRNGLLAMAYIDRSFSDQETEAEITRLRNHPSLIGYLSDSFGQLDCNGFIHNPFAIDDRYMPDSPAAKKLEDFMSRRDALFRKFDPERNYIAQGTGNWKHFMRMTHHYPTNDLNLLDRMMYHKPWSERKEKILPLFLYETGVYNLMNMDSQHPEDRFPVMKERRLVPRLLSREAASRYLGDKAFGNWREYDKLLFRANLRGFRLSGVDAFCPWIDDNAFEIQNTRIPQQIPDRRQLSTRYFTGPFRMEEEWMRMNRWFYQLRALANRPWPAEFGQNVTKPVDSIFTELYRNEMQPLFLAITGDRENPFSMDHNFYAGEYVRKQIGIVNDTPDSVAVSGTITLVVNGRKVESKNVSHIAPQGEIEFLPVEFRLPEVERKSPAELILHANGRTDRFSLTIFPRRKAPVFPKNEKIGIFHHRPGESLAERAGVKGVVLSAEQDVSEDLNVWIVEAGMLTEPIARRIPAFLENGGRVLIFEQTDRSAWSYALEERRLEHLFLSDRTHPAVQGLDDRDLSFWRGRADTVASEKHPSRYFRNSQSAALETPHLTNRNIVAGFVLPLPSYGSIRPIASGGYDRSDSVILEVRSGKGTLLICQADLSGRYGLDPAATLLADNLLSAVLTPVPPALEGVRYTGNESGRKFLEELGIRISSDSPVGVAGPGKCDSRLLADCKTVVRMPGSAFLPKGVRIRKAYLTHETYPCFWNGTYSQFTLLKGIQPGTDFPETAGSAFRGLTPNDFYLFENPQLETFLFDSGTEAERSRFGTAGTVRTDNTDYILCAMDPSLVTKAEERRKILRIWSVLFRNLNVANAQRVSWEIPPLDLTHRAWTFLTDPDGQGEKNGFAEGRFGSRTPRPIRPGILWEEQGVTERNPNLEFVPDSGYDGYGWYFVRFPMPEFRGDSLYLHVNGIRDIWTFSRTAHNTTLFLNGRKMPEAVGIWNAHLGGRGARLWKLHRSDFKSGENLLAIRIYNSIGPGGIHKNPVRFEQEGKNQGIFLPYEFNRDKYTNNFFWCW